LWKGLKSIGVATLVCVRDGKETTETRYYYPEHEFVDNSSLSLSCEYR
jgi:hypothetical protein